MVSHVRSDVKLWRAGGWEGRGKEAGREAKEVQGMEERAGWIEEGVGETEEGRRDYEADGKMGSRAAMVGRRKAVRETRLAEGREGRKCVPAGCFLFSNPRATCC